MLSRAIAAYNRAQVGEPLVEEIVHTGQHFDGNMSQIFFDQMKIPPPVVNLGIKAERHGEMTGRMLAEIEREIIRRVPDIVVVYGDTNSTLAGALAAAKLQVPVAHVEAGLRSFNRRMPEEINRVVTDHLSSYLLCPTSTAVKNLANEGITAGVAHVGDVMYDASLAFTELAERESRILETVQLIPKRYYLATVHRAENTDDTTRLGSILEALSSLSHKLPVVLPLHPRTRKLLDAHFTKPRPQQLRIMDPVSFLDMVQLERHAAVILTDSGGVQKEAYFHGVPCVTLRNETEWVETVEAGWNQVVGTSPARIVAAVRAASPGGEIAEYGNGEAASKILTLLRAGPLR